MYQQNASIFGNLKKKKRSTHTCHSINREISKTHTVSGERKKAQRLGSIQFHLHEMARTFRSAQMESSYNLAGVCRNKGMTDTGSFWEDRNVTKVSCGESCPALEITKTIKLYTEIRTHKVIKTVAKHSSVCIYYCVF